MKSTPQALEKKSTLWQSYARLSSADVEKNCKTDFHNGLETKEVQRRLERYGANSLQSNVVAWQQILLRQFKSSFVYMLMGAAFLSFLFGEVIDGSMVLLFIAITAVLGFYQEYHSERTVEILKQYMVTRARVKRHGKEEMVEMSQLVPGDIVIVETGDIIPADLRFVDANHMVVDESALTGESAPVSKITTALKKKRIELYQADNMGFAGTTVVGGRGEGVVVATGPGTVMGEVTRLTTETVRESSFEKNLGSLSTFLLQMVGITLLFVLGINMILKGNSASITELVLFSIALAVSVIPEALPVVTTFSLSRGALRLAKHKVVVKRLSAIEDLGSIEVLCTDKTGTLTKNQMVVQDVIGYQHRDPLSTAVLASTILTTGLRSVTNSFDLALKGKLTGVELRRLRSFERVSELPFDPERRRNSVLVKKHGHYQLVVRGAPEAILPFCENVDHAERKHFLDWMARMGSQGCRVVAVAEKIMPPTEQYTQQEESHHLIFNGLIAFFDPLKETAEESIRQAHALGVSVKILTGDSREVAGFVGEKIGLVKNRTEVLTGDELDALSHTKLQEAVKHYAVFARVSPQQKYKIIQLLETQCQVGFLGEGINDAPALKTANVAIVVDGASDVAREAAEVILKQKSLHVIIQGIKEGREVFANTIKYITATLSANVGNFFAIATASLLIPYLPMLPLQILLVNLLSDFPMISVATDTVDSEELRRPQGYHMREIILFAMVLGAVSTLFDFIYFAVFRTSPPSVLQTNWFIGSILTELAFIYSLRTKRFFVLAKAPSSTMALLTIVTACLTVIIPYTDWGQRTFHFVAPTAVEISITLGIAATYFVVTEVVKLLYLRFSRSQQPLGQKRLMTAV